MGVMASQMSRYSIIGPRLSYIDIDSLHLEMKYMVE